MAIVLILVLCVIVAMICRLHVTFNYWSSFNIPLSKKNSFAMLWNYLTNWRLSYHMMQLYKMCRNEQWSCVGSFLITRPLLFVACPKLLKEIAVTHSLDFCNRGSYHNMESMEDLNLFNMEDEMWCKWRKIISTGFAPKKMRQYTKIFNTYMSKSMLNLDIGESQTTEIDFFKFANSYASGIAQLIFLGVEESSEESLETNKILQTIFCPTLWNKFTDILSYYYPRFLRLCNASEFPRAAHDRVKKTLKNSLNVRVLPEGSFPQQLVDLQTKDDTVLEENMIGVLSALFIGGLKSTTPLLTYTCYELAKAPDVQEKLRCEILDALDGQGQISYETIKNLPYMQCVLNEVMRLHNGGPLIIRECNQTCTLESIDLTVEKGVLMIGSLRGILMDNEYFPNAEKFYPDRFLNQSLIHQDAFHPFGIGRHICIGNKFALFQAKIFLSLLLSKNYLAVNEKTTKTFCDKNARLAASAIYLNISSFNHC